MSFLLFFCKCEPSTPQLRWWCCCVLNKKTSAHECRNVLQKLSNGDHQILQLIFYCNAELTTNNIKTSNQQETRFSLFQCILTVLTQNWGQKVQGMALTGTTQRLRAELPSPLEYPRASTANIALHEAVSSLTSNLLLQVGAGNFPWEGTLQMHRGISPRLLHIIYILPDGKDSCKTKNYLK
jgi:hypothetical protein